MQDLKHQVFWPPFLFLLICTLLSVFQKEWFFSVVADGTNFIITKFDWLFSWATFLFVVMVAITYFSPLAKVKIGGEQAIPILNKWRWFSITLCTTIATGILFWGSAEPIFHLHQPGISSIEPGSKAAAEFAMSTLFMHWTITPYAMYTLAGLVFALTYYNYKQPFSLGSLMYPILGKYAHGIIGTFVNIICLFSLVAGMAASLGAGILTISGGLERLFEIPGSAFQYALICLVIVLAFALSAATGLLKGIRILSDYNARGFVILAIFVLFTGPIWSMLKLGGAGFLDYIANFLSRSTNINSGINTEWSGSWTVFYWANWLAWAPITALFLGRIALGYTVRQFINFNLLLPALFGGVWMIIFGGSSMVMDMEGAGFPLKQVLDDQGAQGFIYSIFEELPFTNIVSVFFLLLTFLSFVTASDSNTSAMSAVSAHDISPENAESPLIIKLAWGFIIGLVAWTMISYAGIDGIKSLSNLGGFPILFLMIVVLAGLVRMIFFRVGDDG